MSVDETSEFVRIMLDKWLQHLTTCLGQDKDDSSPLSPSEIYSPIVARKTSGRKIAEGRVKKSTSFRLISCWPWRSGALLTLTNKMGEGKRDLEVGALTSKRQDMYKIEILLHLKVGALVFVVLHI